MASSKTVTWIRPSGSKLVVGDTHGNEVECLRLRFTKESAVKPETKPRGRPKADKKGS